MMFLKCIDAFGSQLEEGHVYATDVRWGDQTYAGHIYLKCATPNGGYRRTRFVEATKVELLIAINKGWITVEDLYVG